jgi:hypothetical protein
VNASTLFITNALISHQDGVVLHPDVFLWDKQLSSYRQQWFRCKDNNPLGWYAVLLGVSVSALLASRCSDVPGETKQCWVASPYHAQLGRDTVCLLPEGLFPWTEQDANWLCTILNPLLLQEGITLISVGSALLLSCCASMDVEPARFGEISGKKLPNRHPEGTDAGRFTRLLAEIQMLLHQHPAEHRQQRGEVDVNGIWLWDSVQWPQTACQKQIAVATRNPFLQSVVDGRDAKLMITEAERLNELVKQAAPLPKRIVLAGEGHAVLLAKSLLPKFGETVWNPESPKAEVDLLATFQGLQTGRG